MSKFSDIQKNIKKVRAYQRKIALKFRHRDLNEYLDTNTELVADTLARYYFPLAFRRGHEAAQQIKLMYIHWLILLPAVQAQPGFWRPFWTRQVFISWFRQHLHKNKKYWLGRIKWNWDQADPDAGAKSLRIEDDTFLSGLDDFWGVAMPGEKLRENLARIILGPLAWRVQAEHLLDQCREKSSGLMWWENEALVLSTKPWEYPGLSWTDLRENEVEVEQYVIKAPNGLLNVKMADWTLVQLQRDIKNIAKGKISASYKLHQINNKIKAWESVAKYVAGAKKQAWQVENNIWQAVQSRVLGQVPQDEKNQLKAQYYNLKNSVKAGHWKTSLAFGRRQILMDREDKIDNNLWWYFWRPRR